MKGADHSRGSVVDVVLLFLLIALAGGAALRFIDRHADGDTPQSIATLTLSVTALPTQSADCIARGDVLYHSDGTAFGTIEGLERLSSRVTLEENGVFLSTAPDEARCDLRLYVRTSGSFREGTFFEGGRYAALRGRELSLYTDLSFLRATVIAAE